MFSSHSSSDIISFTDYNTAIHNLIKMSNLWHRFLTFPDFFSKYLLKRQISYHILYTSPFMYFSFSQCHVQLSVIFTYKIMKLWIGSLSPIANVGQLFTFIKYIITQNCPKREINEEQQQHVIYNVHSDLKKTLIYEKIMMHFYDTIKHEK